MKKMDGIKRRNKIKHHPLHKHRLKFVIKRIKKGKTDDEIISEMNALQWIDVNKTVSLYQIKCLRREMKNVNKIRY